MKASFIQRGENLDYTNPTTATITAGTVVIFGSICTIAATDIAAGEVGTVATTGVWEMAKDAAEITAGAKVYYDATNDVVTATAGSNTFVGIATAGATASAAAVCVRLNG